MNRGNATVFGNQRVAGEYDDLTVQGSATADRELSVKNRLVVEGTLNGGVVKAGSLELSGNMQTTDAQVTTARIDGQLRSATLSACDLSGEGMFNVSALRVSGESATSGMLNANEIGADVFRHKGGVQIGKLAAREIDLTIEAKEGGRIDALEGTRVSIKASRSAGPLSVRAINGAEITLERTTAERVEGDTISIGAGCNIGEVLYSKSLSIAPGSTVTKQTKSA